MYRLIIEQSLVLSPQVVRVGAEHPGYMMYPVDVKRRGRQFTSQKQWDRHTPLFIEDEIKGTGRWRTGLKKSPTHVIGILMKTPFCWTVTWHDTLTFNTL